MFHYLIRVGLFELVVKAENATHALDVGSIRLHQMGRHDILDQCPRRLRLRVLIEWPIWRSV